MIKGLKIEGFKSIGQPGLGLRLAPITLILGENSIGKSSIFQAILAVSQSWHVFSGIGQLCPVGPLVDLGRFSSLQHRIGEFVHRDVKVEFELSKGEKLGFCWRAANQLAISQADSNISKPPAGWPGKWSYRQDANFGALSSLRIREFSFLVEALDYGITGFQLTLSSKSIKRWLANNPDPVLEAAIDAGAYLHWMIETGESGVQPPFIESDVLGAEIDPKAIDRLRDLVRSNPEQEGSIWGAATSALRQLPKLRRQLGNCAHIGGIRDRGQRLYEPLITDNPKGVGELGDRIVDLLILYPDALERTNQLLEVADINYRLILEQLPSQAPVVEVLLEYLGKGATQGNKVGLPDVGTGISQILPLAVQIAVFGSRGSFDSNPLILIEQPELHLHPRLQARFAKMMAEAITLDAYEDTSYQATQLLVETHSEHLVRALSVLIEKKELPREAVSIIKLTRNDDDEVVATQMRMDDDGQFLDPWPGGFFPERDSLLDGEIP